MNQKKETGEGSNQRHTLYFVNIIFMSCLTILSLLVALIAIISLRAKGTRGFGKVYTEQQIENIRRDAAEDGEEELRLRIRSSLESGKSSAQVLRELFDDNIVVVFRGRYFFYPVSDKIEKTVLEPGLLTYEDGEVSYTGETPSLEIRQGVLLSDHNGKVDWDTDKFGFATHNSSLGAFYYAAGLKTVEKDADDIPYFPEQANEYVNLVLDKSIKLWTDKSVTWSADRDGYSAVELQKIFEEGRGLFMGEVMQLVFRLREMDLDFGLIPFPKYDSNQKNYGHFVHSTSAMLSIPVSCKNIDKIGPFVEAMAYESMYTVTPAYYETALTGKYFRDPESTDMLTIILQSRTFDLGSVHMFNWGNVAGTFTDLLAKGSSAYASAYAKKIKSGKKALDKSVAKLLK